MAPGFRSDSTPQRCPLCHTAIAGAWLETPLGERFCPAHQNAPACRACAAPTTAGGPLCTRCTRSMVDSQDRVKAVLPKVRTGLHSMGLRLATPVRVRLIESDEMARLSSAAAGAVLGLTIVANTDVVDLVVLTGLSGPEFGAVVAHESMHAWLAQRSFGELSPAVAEGICELASDGWLEQQRDPRARLLRDAIAANPDPVYGRGFRAVRDAVRRHGLVPVLSSVRRTGALP